MGEGTEDGEQFELLEAFCICLVCWGDAFNFVIACVNVLVDRCVQFSRGPALTKDLHPCLVSLGGIMLLMVGADF